MANEFVARKGLISLQTSSFIEDVNISGSVYIGTAATSSHLTVSGSQYISKTLTVDGGITGSLYGTSSWAVSASWSPIAVSASYVVGAVSASYIDFAQTADLPAQTGRLQWESDFGTLEFTLRGGTVTVPLGFEELSYVYNYEATTLNKGEVVYVSGSNNDRIGVKRASALDDSTSARTLGLVADSIAAGGSGYVITRGILRDVDTSMYNAGDILFVSSSAGQVTNIKPQAPIHMVYAGFVTRVGAGNGIIFVMVQNGYELDEIHDVRILNKSTGDLLVQSSSGLWVNSKTLVGQYNLTGSMLVTGSIDITGSLTSSKDILVNSVSIGRGRGNNSDTIAIGNDIFSAVTNAGYPINCIAIGTGASYTGSRDTISIGKNAGRTGGQRSIAIGWDALYGSTGWSLGTGGNDNVAIGWQAGYNITSIANDNVFIGNRAGYGAANYAGGNVYIGNDAGFNNVSGAYNVSIGYGSDIYKGNENVVLGYQAMIGTTGYYNTLVGPRIYVDGTYTNEYNSVFGYDAGWNLGNTGPSTYNTILGSNSGQGIRSGSNNTVIGARVSIGNNISNTIAIGDGAGNIRYYVNSSGNTAIGKTSPINAKLDVLGDVAITGSLNITGSITGSLLGTSSYAISSATSSYVQFTSYNVRLADGAGNSVSSGTGIENVFIGRDAGYSVNNGSQNIFIGPYSGYNNNGIYNVSIGYNAGAQGGGNENVFVGNNTGGTEGSGTYTIRRNVTIGSYAGSKLGKTGFSEYNTLLGYYAASGLESGSNNTVIGRNAGYNLYQNYDNTIIGANVDIGAVNSTIAIGDGAGNIRYYVNSSGNTAIGKITPINAKLDVLGDVAISGSLRISGSITGSLLGTSSWAVTSSYSLKAESLLSGININVNEVTASSILVTNLYVQNITSSTELVTGSLTVSGSLNAVGGVTGSVFGTSSYALQALTSSYLLGAASSSYVQFAEVTASQVTNAVGKLQWDELNRTLKFGLGGGNVNLQVGQENLVLVYNADATQIVDGEVLYITGSFNDRLAVKKASNTDDVTSLRTICVATEPINVGEIGFAAIHAEVNDLNTSAFSVGDLLWLDSTPGAFTNIKPDAPFNAVFVGTVLKVGVSDGKIHAYVQSIPGLKELHDVQISSIQNNQILKYNLGNNRWENFDSNTLQTTIKTSNYTITSDDYVVIGNSATPFTITMLPANVNTNRNFVIKNKGSGKVTIDATGLGQIDGTNTYILNRYQSITLISDGTNWNII